jgi:hypothetical protein
MPEEVVKVERVEARKTQSGNTRFVLSDDRGREFTPLKDLVADDIRPEDEPDE